MFLIFYRWYMCTYNWKKESFRLWNYVQGNIAVSARYVDSWTFNSNTRDPLGLVETCFPLQWSPLYQNLDIFIGSEKFELCYVLLFVMFMEILKHIYLKINIFNLHLKKNNLQSFFDRCWVLKKRIWSRFDSPASPNGEIRHRSVTFELEGGDKLNQEGDNQCFTIQ